MSPQMVILLSIVGGMAAIILTFILGITIQGKMTGGMGRSEAWMEIFRELTNRKK